MKKEILVSKNVSVKEVLKELDRTAEKTLLVVDQENRLLGTITDGDIRRYLLKGKSLEDDIKGIYCEKPTFVRDGKFTLESVKKIFIKKKINLLPVLDEKNRVVDYIVWDKVFSEEAKLAQTGKIDVPVVVMAGGKGTRLEPFTNILPKPLIPINDKPVIELIIEKFRGQGAKEYYLILNFKGEMIKAYFSSIERDYKVTYVWESDFLGTAGGLKLIEDMNSDIFIVSNCDVIVKADFEEVISLHKKNNAAMTILSSIQHYKLPYGVIKFRNNGVVTDVVEKPEYTTTINTGVYVLNKYVTQFIPERKHFDMPDLIRTLIEHNQKVVTYPVNQNDYIDTGQWEGYRKAVEKLRYAFPATRQEYELQ